MEVDEEYLREVIFNLLAVNEIPVRPIGIQPDYHKAVTYMSVDIVEQIKKKQIESVEDVEKTINKWTKKRIMK